MIERIAIKDFLGWEVPLPIIDVRTPAEFEMGHIPGAENIPLFSNAERASVGTVFKQVSPEKAYEIGYKFVEPKLDDFVSASKAIAKDNKLAVYCWRGGMRSRSFAEHIEENGIGEVYVIEGGYKAFRNYALESFNTPENLLILGGYTGSGKTRILKEMKAMGEQVIDLEGIANHKGSAFGAIGQAEQPPNEHFANLLFWEWKDLDQDRPVWLEDESIHIGKVFIPEVLFQRMRDAQLFFIDIPKEERAKLLVEDYPHSDKALLADAIHRITKRLGGQNAQQALEALEQNDFYTTAFISLSYYDKFYKKGMDRRDASKVKVIKSEDCDSKKNAGLILKEI